MPSEESNAKGAVRRGGPWSDLVSVWKALGRVSFLLTCLGALSFPALVEQVLEPGRPLWNAVALTLPLTMVVTFLALVGFRGWFAESQWLANPFIFSSVVASLFLGAWFLSDQLGVTEDSNPFPAPPPGESSTAPYGLMGDAVLSYYRAYGFRSFASAIVAGIFLAWVADRILPGGRRGREADAHEPG